MTPLEQTLLVALREVAHGGALRDLERSRRAFVALRKQALDPGHATTSVERVTLRALARFHARFSEQARLDVCTVVTMGALMRAAALECGKELTPKEIISEAMNILAIVQGTGPLVPRSTLGSADGGVSIGDFHMGPWRHDGRWRLVVDARGPCIVDIDVGRRLARRIGSQALEIASRSPAGLRDVAIHTTPAGYRVVGRSRMGPASPMSIEVTASGIVDWPSFTPIAASADSAIAPHESSATAAHAASATSAPSSTNENIAA